MRFGLHVSISGSFAEAARRAVALSCDCFQMFAGSPRSYRRSIPTAAEAKAFRDVVGEHDLAPVVVHAGYMLHLLSAKPKVAASSSELLKREYEIAQTLGADCYVLHPGSAGADRERSINTLCEALSGLPRGGPAVLIENSAHTSVGIGASLKEIGRILRLLGDDKRFGAVFDTAHAVGAGYDLSTSDAVGASLRRIYREVGRSRIGLVHANDSRVPTGSGRDLHEHIGKGAIGVEGFGALLADRTLARKPFILETPVDGPEDNPRNLARLRELAGDHG